MKKYAKYKEKDESKPNLSQRVAQAGIPPAQIAAILAVFAICAAVFLRNYSNAPFEFAGQALVCFLILCVIVAQGSRYITGRKLSNVEVYVLSGIILTYFAWAYFAARITLYEGFLPKSILLPSALFVMLISILIDMRLAMTMALSIPLGALATRCLDLYGCIVAISSSVAGAMVIRGARRRMDLVMAGITVACVNVIATFAVLLVEKAPSPVWLPILFWALLNGAVSGALVLGILPLFERALHMATTFKLIELLDTEAPLLRRMESVAPGTYSHSMEVAKLAECACRDIGANALLARVGAYYHDIGKIDKPEYFVENQSIYNKHNELNPRLSATVIRSHVKLGMEKARAIGLPDEVAEFIGTHHGDSLIAWFYSEALKREGEGNVNQEDFCYPGHPPHSREAAVMMLADVVEAACRTLDKPTAARLEKFTGDLIDKKIESRQLVNSELTFHEIEVIKKAFLRVLVAHYHARIEYPDQNMPAKAQNEPNGK
ncbi:MAG: HDIG domain-containing protein [Spirochaetaceae bacterium]|jgi:putative nucleotidyltransferase with HDIG domain|nr:HDIG domain-containing protein [Spirochaetaceae bacterium]